jgi:pimeloyl-ACP methyl ester carboxylesterase
MDGIAAGRRLTMPALFLAATQDVNGGFDFAADAKALYRAAATKDKRLVLLPGYEHGIGLVGSSAKARASIESFLKGH